MPAKLTRRAWSCSRSHPMFIHSSVARSRRKRRERAFNASHVWQRNVHTAKRGSIIDHPIGRLTNGRDRNIVVECAEFHSRWYSAVSLVPYPSAAEGQEKAKKANPPYLGAHVRQRPKQADSKFLPNRSIRCHYRLKKHTHTTERVIRFRHPWFAFDLFSSSVGPAQCLLPLRSTQTTKATHKTKTPKMDRSKDDHLVSLPSTKRARQMEFPPKLVTRPAAVVVCRSAFWLMKDGTPCAS